MKRQLLFYCLLISFPIDLSAQRDPSNEILVYFKEGVECQEKIEEDIKTSRQLISSDKLKLKLKSLGSVLLDNQK